MFKQIPVYNSKLSTILHKYIIVNSKMMCSLQSNKEDLISIFSKSIEAVLPSALFKNIYLNKNTLYIYGKSYHVNNNCYIVGFGKAVYGMSIELEKILGNHLVWGFVSIPFGMKKMHPNAGKSRVMYMEGAAHNLPDKYAEIAAKEIAELAKPLTKRDLLLCLISGGGSALLPAPIAPISLVDKTTLIRLLANRGADIVEINTVRKRLSKLKGGGLAVLAHPANVVSLILSDVIGDPLDFIASGPTVPNTDPPGLAKTIVSKYVEDEDAELPPSIRNFFLLSDGKSRTKLPPVSNGCFEHVSNILIGNNKLAMEKAAEHARNLGFDVTIMSTCVSADVAIVSKAYQSIAIEIYKTLMLKSSKKRLVDHLESVRQVLCLSDDAITSIVDDLDFDSVSGKCLIFGGEPTVRVQGDGKGGRNQQLALQFAIDLDRTLDECGLDVVPMTLSLLSGGTDGVDGPTSAAGAIGFNGLCHLAAKNNLNPNDYVARNDSYNFFKTFQNGRFLLRTGHTGTNVMDVHVLLIKIRD